MKKLGFYCIALLLLTACAQKALKHAVIGEDMNPQKLPSIVTISENFVIAATTIVSVSGKIFGSYIHERKDTITDPLEFSNVVFTNVETKEVFGKVTKKDGSYTITIPAATYQIKAQFIGFNTIIIKNIQLGTGEIFNFSANLGQGIGKEYFKIKSNKTTRKLIRKTN